MLDVGRWMLDVFITAFLLHGEELHDVNREMHPSRNAPSGNAGQCPTSSAPCVGEFLFLHDVFAREDHIFAVSWNSSTISLSIGYFPRRVPLIAHTRTSLVPLSPSTARSCTSATLQPMRAVEIAVSAADHDEIVAARVFGLFRKTERRPAMPTPCPSCRTFPRAACHPRPTEISPACRVHSIAPPSPSCAPTHDNFRGLEISPPSPRPSPDRPCRARADTGTPCFR